MKRSGIVWAILGLALLVIVAPAMKTFFEKLSEIVEAEASEEGWSPFVEIIFENITLFIIIVAIGAVGWAVFKHFKGKGGTRF